MTVIDVERLQKAKEFIDGGGNCDSVSIENGLQITPEAIEWLKANHYQIKVAESFGPTGITAIIYPV